jgi:hypothetical protein
MAEALFRMGLPKQWRPTVRGRVFRLLDESDVNDPYHEGDEAYESMWQAVCEGVRRWSWRLSQATNGRLLGNEHEPNKRAARE